MKKTDNRRMLEKQKQEFQTKYQNNAYLSQERAQQEVKIANYAERKDLTEALRPYEAFMMKIQ